MNKDQQTQAPRLSLQDFKVKALDNKKEIEKLMGGLVAADCHRVTGGFLPDGGIWCD